MISKVYAPKAYMEDLGGKEKRDCLQMPRGNTENKQRDSPLPNTVINFLFGS